MAKRGSKSRSLTTQEQALWQKVTKDVIDDPNLKTNRKKPQAMPQVSLAKPVTRRNLKSTAANIRQPDPLEAGYLLKLMQRFDTGLHTSQETQPKPNQLAHGRKYTAPQVSHEKPQNLPLDRNIRQKLQRGRVDIEARLDLHGYNRDNAQTRLMSFLRSSWQQGFKTVIVVTGKGDGSIARHSLHSADFFSMPEQRAVLRASIGDWLNSTEAAQFVIGWQPAHPKHGGGGAVYVRIRSRSNRAR